MTTRLTSRACVALAALCATGTASAQTYENGSGGSVTFYGQLSPTYQRFDDGGETSDNAADNGHSNSRVGFNLHQELENGATLRFNVETALGAPQTSAYSQGHDPEWEWEKTDIRKVDLSLSGGWGTLSFGQGSMASDNTSTHDLSGTGMASAVSIGDTAGGFRFRQKNGELSDIAISDVFRDLDGGRRGRIRYDTPGFHGLTLSAAYGQDILSDGNDNEYYDIGLSYADTLGDFRMEGGVNMAWVDHEDPDDITKSWSGSISALHTPTGLNLTLAAGEDPDGGNFEYAKVGWIADFVSVGSTAISADYYAGEDFVTNGSDSEQWGVQVTQKVDALNMEAYVGYAEYSFEDDTGAHYQDASSVLAGMRWKF